MIFFPFYFNCFIQIHEMIALKDYFILKLDNFMLFLNHNKCVNQ